MRFDIIIRFGVIILAILQPIIVMFFYGGNLPSLSSVWLTDLQPLFIISNAATSYFLFDIKSWKLSGILLLLLTAFSVEFNLVIHNIISGLFFLSCIRSMNGINRLGGYIYPYIFSLFLWMFFGMFWGEIFAVYVICAYHIHLMIYSLKIVNRKKEINL